jgi:hypothetical protein
LRGGLSWPIRRAKARLPELQPVPVTSPQPVDRRKSERFLCDLMATCQIVTLMDFQPLPAHVRDMSAAGIGLQTHHRLEVGTFLVIELEDGNGGKGARLCVKVMHSTLDDDGLWRIGCFVIHETVGPKEIEEEERLVLSR